MSFKPPFELPLKQYTQITREDAQRGRDAAQLAGVLGEYPEEMALTAMGVKPVSWIFPRPVKRIQTISRLLKALGATVHTFSMQRNDPTPNLLYSFSPHITHGQLRRIGRLIRTHGFFSEKTGDENAHLEWSYYLGIPNGAFKERTRDVREMLMHPFGIHFTLPPGAIQDPATRAVIATYHRALKKHVPDVYLERVIKAKTNQARYGIPRLTRSNPPKEKH